MMVKAMGQEAARPTVMNFRSLEGLEGGRCVSFLPSQLSIIDLARGGIAA